MYAKSDKLAGCMDLCMGAFGITNLVTYTICTKLPGVINPVGECIRGTSNRH